MKNIVYKPIFLIGILVVTAGFFGFVSHASGYYMDSYYPDSYYTDPYYNSYYPDSYNTNSYYPDSYYTDPYYSNSNYYMDSYYPSSYIQPPTVLFVANPVTIKRGESVALSWTSTDADYCVASGGWRGDYLFPSGAQTLRPEVTTTYSITCNGSGGTAASKITVTVVEAPIPAPIQNPPPTYTYYNPYQVPSYPIYGTAPSVNITVTPSSIVRGQAVTVSWTSTNASSCYASNAWSGNKNLSGSEVYYPQQTSVYTITCSNSYGSNTDTKTAVVNIPVITPSGLGVACSPSTGTSAIVGRSVTFNATSVGGATPITYRWSGDASGIGTTVSASYSTLGRKTAVVTATDGLNRSASASCYVDIGAVQAATTAAKPKPPVVRTVTVTESECEMLCREKGYVKASEVNLSRTDTSSTDTTDEASATTTGERPSFLSFLAFGGGTLPPGLGLFLFILFVIFLTFATVMVMLRFTRKQTA